MRLYIFSVVVLCSFVICLPTSWSHNQEQDSDNCSPLASLSQTADHFSSVIKKVQPAVVYIQATKKKREASSNIDKETGDNFFDESKYKKKKDSFFIDDTSYGFGSGFIINQQGYILTNNHVIADATEITVTLSNKKSFQAKLVGTDAKTDIGLIKIDHDNSSPLPAARLGDSDKLKVGEWVLAIGSPYEYIQSVTAGIVSATGRSSIGVSDYESFIQTDAAINPGNSGGPLVNIHGKIIGINTAFLTQTGGYSGIGFAIPINIARKVTEQLIKDGKVTRAWLGVAIQDATREQIIAANLPPETTGARVVDIKQNSPAEKSGIQKGDIIFAINDNTIDSAADLRNRISLHAPDSIIVLQLSRDKTTMSRSAKLGILK